MHGDVFIYAMPGVNAKWTMEQEKGESGFFACLLFLVRLVIGFPMGVRFLSK